MALLKESFQYLPEIEGLWFVGPARGEVEFLIKEIFEDLEYFKHGIQLKPNDVIFDVGANIGIFSLFAYLKCQKQCSLYLFEPIPKIFQALKKNMSHPSILNRSKIQLFQLGLGSSIDKRVFSFFKFAPCISSSKNRETYQHLKTELIWALNPFHLIEYVKIHRPYIAVILNFFLFFPLIILAGLSVILIKHLFKEFVECQISTISKVIQENGVSHIDLLKVDVEGDELEVLQGVQAEDWKKIQQVVIEVNDIDDRLNQVKTLLEASGFQKTIAIQSEWNRYLGSRVTNVYALKQGG